MDKDISKLQSRQHEILANLLLDAHRDFDELYKLVK